MSDTIDLDELERLAKAATPGPWSNYRNIGYSMLYGPAETRASVYAFADNDADYIAAANPTTILALIARVREAEAQADKWRAKAQQEHADWSGEVVRLKDENAELRATYGGSTLTFLQPIAGMAHEDDE